LVSGVAHPSSSEGPLAAGSYSFTAHYNGDTTYAAADSTCEPLTVSKASPTLTTVPEPASATVGGTLNDQATVAGSFKPTGSTTTGNVTFRLFAAGDARCTGTAAFINIVAVNGDGTYNTSAGFVSNAVG